MADAAAFDRKMAPDGCGAERCVWHEVPGAPARVEGLAFFDSEKRWDRLPQALQPVLKQVRPALAELSRHMAGASLRFYTDSPEVWLKAQVESPPYMSHMTPAAQCGFDCYVRLPGQPWAFAGLSKFPLSQSTFCVRLARGLPGRVQVCINLPLYTGVRSLAVGLAPGAQMHCPPPPVRSAVAFYGTSITQGGCASRPGMAYPAILGRMLDRPTYNFGFSGNGVALAELADAICAAPGLGALVVDVEANAGPEGLLEENLPRFLDAVRTAAPALPVLLLCGTVQADCRWDSRAADCWQGYAAFERREAERRAAEGDRRIFLANAAELIGGPGAEATVDGIHLTDLGFYALASGLAPVLEAIME